MIFFSELKQEVLQTVAKITDILLLLPSKALTIVSGISKYDV